MEDLARGVVMCLGGIVLAVVTAAGVKFAWRYRETYEKRFAFMALQRLGTALGSLFIIAELGNHAGEPLTYRTPFAFGIFSIVLIAVVGIVRDET